MPKGDGLFLSINEFAKRTPWLHGITADYAKYGIVLFALAILFAWWRARSASTRAMGLVLLIPVATVLAFAVQQLVVMLVDEARPYAVHTDALVLVSRTTDPSFPSDHACVTAAIAVGLLYVHRTLGFLTAAGALLMAVTRVYVGAHWPLDVVVGLALGALVSLVAMQVLRTPAVRIIGWLAGTPLRPIVSAR